MALRVHLEGHCHSERSRGIPWQYRGMLRLRCASLRLTMQACVIKFLAASENGIEFYNLSS
jgi:hypothetical protein